MDFLSIFTATWLGILTSISPCPLVSNIAAVSFISRRITRKEAMIISGVFYTVGRSVTYIIMGSLIVKALIDIPVLSDILQRHINKILGIVLVLTGMVLLDLIHVKIPALSVTEKAAGRLVEGGILGSLALGVLFALAFCPVSAALFFGGLIPVAVKAGSGIALPLFYGVGTGLPVLVFAFLIGIGAEYVGRAYQKATRIEFYTKKLTGIIFILVGIYYVLAYIFVLF